MPVIREDADVTGGPPRGASWPARVFPPCGTPDSPGRVAATRLTGWPRPVGAGHHLLRICDRRGRHRKHAEWLASQLSALRRL